MNHWTERAHSSFASARSASESVAGSAVHWFSTMPSCAFVPVARIACIASPCESSRWCETWIACLLSATPGANWALP
jgi:hypothetical protein